MSPLSIAAMTGVPDKAEESVRSGWSAMTPGGAGPEPGQLGTHTRDTGGAHTSTHLRITQKNLTTGKNRYSTGKPFKNTGGTNTSVMDSDWFSDTRRSVGVCGVRCADTGIQPWHTAGSTRQSASPSASTSSWAIYPFTMNRSLETNFALWS